ILLFFFSSRRRHTRSKRDWSSDVCSSDLPLEVVDGVAPVGEEPLPLYEFEPSPEGVLDALLPRYIRARMFNALLQAAASELAARQRAMHTAVDNAEDIIRNYTRLANQARQAEITQEISEIVSGADALAAS